MALEDLIARLEHEAQSRVQAIQREADDEVRRIGAATEQAVSEATARRLERGHAGRRIDQQRALAEARRQARARELGARRAQLVRVFARARALVSEVAESPAYATAIPTHLVEALSFLERVPARVRCHPAHIPLLTAVMTAHAEATLVADDSVAAGLVAEAVDGSVVVDNTLAARLARIERRAAIELSRRLGHAAP